VCEWYQFGLIHMFQCCDMFVCVVHNIVPAVLSVASAAHQPSELAEVSFFRCL